MGLLGSLEKKTLFTVGDLHGFARSHILAVVFYAMGNYALSPHQKQAFYWRTHHVFVQSSVMKVV